MRTIRLKAIKDIKCVDSFIFTGEEVRVGRITPDGKRVMIVDMKDDLHIWLDMDKFNECVESEIV